MTWEPEGEAETATMSGMYPSLYIAYRFLSSAGAVPLCEPLPLSPRRVGVMAAAWIAVYQAETAELWR
jgi:hypothetical protein